MTEAPDCAQPLAESAYRRLRADILACRLQPGQRITERALAKETGLGVSPIRDALTRLDHEGLIRTIPRKGYQVAPLTVKVIDDLSSFWQLIAPEVIKRGVTNATDEQLDRVANDLKGIDRVGPVGQDAGVRVGHFFEIVDEMFTTLAEASDNSYLAAAYAKVSGEVFRAWTLLSDSDLFTPMKLVNLADWFDLLRRRDADALAEKAREYVQACHDHAAQTLARWPSVMTSEVVPLRAR
jgi:DNA-binding GntR family transcriptional regulator